MKTTMSEQEWQTVAAYRKALKDERKAIERYDKIHFTILAARQDATTKRRNLQAEVEEIMHKYQFEIASGTMKIGGVS